MQAIDYVDPPVILVTVDVTNLEQAATFYTQIFSFRRGWDGLNNRIGLKSVFLLQALGLA